MICRMITWHGSGRCRTRWTRAPTVRRAGPDWLRWSGQGRLCDNQEVRMMCRPFAFVMAALLITGLTACVTAQPGSGTTARDRSDAGSVAGRAGLSRIDLPFEARGNEPGWLLVINDQITLDWAYGQHHAQMPRTQPERRDGGILYTGATAEHTLDVRITDDMCRDSMTGMPYPRTVTVIMDGTKLAGCGGRSQSLLVGDEWVVEDMANAGIIDASRMTLNFDD